MAITVRKTDAQLGNNVRQIAPTLLIGLGGSGKEVLLRIRRRFYERFGEVGFPIISYLWIDTDMRNLDLEGEKYDYLMEKVAFAPDEKIDAQLPGASFTAYFRDPESHPHIFSWLDPSLASYGQVIDGAGQKRPFGRLAFFHNHRKIRERLLAMKNSVLDQRAADGLRALFRRHSVQEPEVDRGRLDVIFICSVAGGTGSGMFLDAAFFARDVLSANAPNLTGYLLLPRVFNPDVNSQAGQPIYANGYAALKELEHYSLAKDLLSRRDDVRVSPHFESDHLFKVEWSRGEAKNLQGPPFNTCYLLDNQSKAAREALGPQNKKSLCDMVAEAVFLDFNEGSFAAAKRSTRSNLEQFLLSKVDMDYEDRESGNILFTDVFSCRFSSFGLSKLYIPADRIRRWCAYRLSIELLDSLLASPEAPGDLSLQVRKHHFEPMGIEETLLLRALARNGENSDSQIRDDLDRLIDEQAIEWRDALPESASQKVRALREKLQREMLRDSDPRARPGDYLARISLANPKILATQLFGRFDPENDDLWAIVNDDPARRDSFGVAPVGSIGRVVRGWLEDPRFRLPLARAYLQATAAYFREEMTARWTAEAEDSRHQAQQRNESIQRRLGMLESEEEAGKLLPSKRALLRRLRRDLRGWAGASIEELVYRTAVEFVRTSLLPYLERLDRFLVTLEEDLGKVRAELTVRRAAFEQEKEHAIFEEVLDASILEASYSVRTAEGYRKVNAELLQRFEVDFLRSLEVQGTADLAYAVALSGVYGFANSLEGLAFERFRGLPVRFDVIEEFRRTRGDKVEEGLRSWARRATVWLPRSEVVDRFKELDSTAMDIAFLGAPETVKAENRRLLQKIKDTLNENEPPRSGAIQELLTFGTDSLYVYSEVAGVSLPCVPQIDRYFQEAYLSSLRRETVHIDFHEERFPDEVVLRDFVAVRRFLEAYRLLLIGTITGVLLPRRGSSGRTLWSYMDFDKRPPQPAELGPELFALNTLQRQEVIARRIDGQMSDAIRNLSPERKVELYAVLLADLDPAGSFPLRWRFRPGAGTEEVNSHGRLILNDEAAKLEDLLRSDYGADKSFLTSRLKTVDPQSMETVSWQDPPLKVLKTSILEGEN
ncbi:MAG TPA: tubulin-like doman-containing protein [Thermoanaerobaculia bacterium]|jgi:hypothetical protein|nr:tubulin-like doman-containing protein [Thermoanaerobaculia bacterium]